MGMNSEEETSNAFFWEQPGDLFGYDPTVGVDELFKDEELIALPPEMGKVEPTTAKICETSQASRVEEEKNFEASSGSYEIESGEVGKALKKRDRSNRRDIHFKKVIRRVRQHYYRRLQAMKYTTRKPFQPPTFYRACITEILTGFGIEASPRMVFYCAAMIYRKDTEALLDTLMPPDLTKAEALEALELL